MSPCVKARPFVPGDDLLVTLRPELDLGEDFDDPLHGLPQPRYLARTLLLDGRPFAVLGVLRQRRSLGQAFARFGTPPAGAARVALTTARVLLGEASMAWGLTRIEATCKADFSAGNAFLAALGFHVESRMPRRLGLWDELLWARMEPC